MSKLNSDVAKNSPNKKTNVKVETGELTWKNSVTLRPVRQLRLVRRQH